MKKGYYIPVLAYHAVSPMEQYYHNLEEFEQQIKWLSDHGYTGISLEMYWKHLSGEISDENLPEKPVLIVFDDGRDSNYTYAFPVLRKYNMNFTLFIIGEKVGDRDFVTWQQIREMVESGLCSLGSHTSDLHYFELENANAQAWGALATRVWKDNGIYAYLNQGQAYSMESYFALPIAGTAKNYDTGRLYPIESDKSMVVDRVIVKCPTHIPSETYYDMNVRVSIGIKRGPIAIGSETVVNPSWRPKREPIDLVNESSGTTWVNGRYDVIHFDQSYSVVKGQWYNLHFQTLNTVSTQNEFRIYMDPSLPFDLKNCATNSQSSDYNAIDGWAFHHGLPMMILSNGSGRNETYEEYYERVTADTINIKRQLEERAGSCIQSTYHYSRQIPNTSWESAIPLFGASNTTVATYDNETGEFIGYDVGPFEPLESYFRIVFDTRFSCSKIKVTPVRQFGRQYAALCDVYIGRWNSGSPNSFTRVRRGFTASYSWNGYGDGLEIEFDKGISFLFEKDIEYCIHFKTLNYDYIDSSSPSEGVFRIAGDWIENSSQVTGIWNSRAGDGEGDRYIYACVNPKIAFYSESSTYPIGKYSPPVWSIAFPFGAYTDELNQIQSEIGMRMQFTIYSGVFDNRPYRNEAAVDDPHQIPRIMMIKSMPAFPDVVKSYTLEKYLPTERVAEVQKYAWIIHREWGAHSLKAHWDQIDVAIFDAYNFDTSLNISGEPNKDWLWFKNEKKKKVYACFGNFGATGFEPNIASAVFNDPINSTNKILRVLQDGNWDGCAIDFEEVNPADREKAVQWFRYLADKLHDQNKYYDIVVASPYPDPADLSWEEWFDYSRIGAVVDKLIPMTYLDHGSWTDPGPISHFGLFKQRYRKLLKFVPPHKIIAGLGVFGCQWIEGKGEEKNLIELTALSGGVAASLKDTNADEWYCHVPQGTLWFQAPDTYFNRIKWIYNQGISAISIWKIDDDDDNWWNNDVAISVNLWDLINVSGNLARIKHNLEMLGYSGLRNANGRLDEEWTEAFNIALWKFIGDYGLTNEYIDSGFEKSTLYNWIQEAADGFLSSNGTIPHVPVTLPDGTPITSANKENEVTFNYFMKYVYRKNINYSSEIPYTAYMAWLADTYGMNNLENFWDVSGKAAIGFFEGLWESVKDTIGGIWNIFAHFDETVEGVKFLFKAATNPAGEEARLLWAMIENGISSTWNDLTTGDAETQGRIVGKLVGDIVLGIIGTKGLDKAVKAIRSVEVGSLASLMSELKNGSKSVDEVIAVLSLAAEAFDRIKDAINTSTEALSSLISKLYKRIEDAIEIEYVGVGRMKFKDNELLKMPILLASNDIRIF